MKSWPSGKSSAKKFMTKTIDLVRGERAKRSHLAFMRYLWRNKKQNLIEGYHTKLICERIDRAIIDYKNGKSTYLKIKCPFRHGKSDMVSRYLPANFIGHFPNDEVIVAGYSSGLVRKFSRFARDLLRDNRYKNVHKGVTLSQEVANVEEWGIQDEIGLVQWRGMSGTITGSGGNLIVIDDYCKSREEAESEVKRESAWECFQDIITRCAPTVIFIVLATPWHVDDIFGRIDKAMAEDDNFPKFEELSFPAKSSQYESGYLFPERYSRQWYEGMYAALGPYGSSGLLDCDPQLKVSQYIRTDKIQFVDEMPTGLRWVRGWDLASGAKETQKQDPDYTVGTRMAVKWESTAVSGVRIPIIYVDDVIHGQWLGAKRNQIIRDTAIADGEIPVGIEAFGAYKDAYTTIRDILRGLRTVKKMNLQGDKIAKASSLEAPFEAGNVFFKKAPWNDFVVKQLNGFPGLPHDDVPDSFAVAYNMHNTKTQISFGSTPF